MTDVDAVTIALMIVTAVLAITSLAIGAVYHVQAYRAPPLPTEMIFKGRRNSEVMTHVGIAARRLRFKLLETSGNELVFKSMYQRFVPGPVIRAAFVEDRDGVVVNVSSEDVGSYGWRAAAINVGRLVREVHGVMDESATDFR